MPQGHLQPSLSIAGDGGLSSDSFRARSVPTTEESGQLRKSLPPLPRIRAGGVSFLRADKGVAETTVANWQ